jgi:hypothetical protein
MDKEIIIARAGYASREVPAGTHTVVAITANYYGIARAEGQEPTTAQSLAVQAISNMVYEGGRRSWGYLLYCFGPGIAFEAVHPVNGGVSWTFDNQDVPVSEQPEPTRVGVRGPKVRL